MKNAVLSRLFRALALPALGLWTFATISPVWAAVVLQMGVADLSEKAESVVHGRVVSTESAWTANRKSIVTHVTLEVLDALKGDAAREVTLTFTGGTVDGVSLSLSGLRIPAVGEEGIYFIESMTRGLDCPILGWNQGHFRVRAQGGVRRVFTSDWHPVTELDLRAGGKAVRFNEDVARGVTTGESVSQALGVDVFKDQLFGRGGAR